MYYNTYEFQVSESFILGMPAGNMLILEQKVLGWTMGPRLDNDRKRYENTGRKRARISAF